jgi:hypothetical protein
MEADGGGDGEAIGYFEHFLGVVEVVLDEGDF